MLDIFSVYYLQKMTLICVCVCVFVTSYV